MVHTFFINLTPSSYSDYSIAHGLLFTTMNNITYLSQSPFADHLLSNNGKNFTRILPTMFGKSLTSQSSPTNYTNILFVASFKQLGARYLAYDSSYDLVQNIQTYLKRLSRYSNCRMIINIRLDNIELSECSLADALSEFNNYTISSQNISYDISLADLVVSQSSTVLEEALCLNKYVSSPASNTYSHFNDLHEVCQPYLTVCRSTQLDYARYTFRSPVYSLSDDYYLKKRLSLKRVLSNH